MKHYIYLLSILLIMNTISFASTYCTQNEQLVSNPLSLSNVITSVKVLDDSTELSKSLLQNSEEILALSTSLLNAGSSANPRYVEAMLQLSKDILKMADKIGDMADRILVMADDIGDMADRILITQEIQNKNVDLTQANILKAQENFNEILK